MHDLENEKLRPLYYRLLEKGEIINPGDLSIMNGDWQTLDAGNYVVGQDYKDSVMKILRPVICDEWIEYAKQKPAKEDFEPTGTILVLRNDTDLPLMYYTTDLTVEHLWNFPNAKPQFWLRITPPKPAKPKSVTVNLKLEPCGAGERKLEVKADGTAIAGCETYSAESIDTFIKARQEVTKKDL